MHNTSRGRVASLVAGLVATSMLTLTAGSAGAVEAGTRGGLPTAVTAATSDREMQKAVKSNQFGTMRSVVRGTFGKNGVVTGTFTPRRFIVEDGTLKAKGLLHATLTRGSGKVVGTKDKVVTIDVKSVNGVFQGRAAERPACDVLRLVLGPLDLNLLGLRVQLNRVVLNITAEPGPGNLLGNLLCAVAGLLDNSGVLAQVRQILNSILGILRL